MNPNQNLQIPLFHTTYQYHWILIKENGPYRYDTGKSHTLLPADFAIKQLALCACYSLLCWALVVPTGREVLGWGRGW